MNSCDRDKSEGQMHAAVPGTAPCGRPVKITTINPEDVYDLSGYADESGGKPFNLFDENAFVDPRDEKKGDNYIPTTNPQPLLRPAIYFPLKRGNRIVTDLRVPFRLSEIYLYDRSTVNDSVYIYTGDMLHWKLKAAFETRSDPGMWGWRKFQIDDSARYFMIVFNSYLSNITEAVPYGCPCAEFPRNSPDTNTAAVSSKKTMKAFLGVNYIIENDPKWLMPFHYNRLYNFALDFDNDSSENYPGVKYNMLHYGRWNQGKREYEFNIDALQKINDGQLWFSIRGVAMWMAKKGFTERDRPVTRPGMDPENPLSYARHANMMWNMAAFFGRNKVDSSLMSLSHEPRISGRGPMEFFENGNEEDAWWEGKRYCSPMEYFAQSSADFDGHGSVLGKNCGIANADPQANLITSGMVGLDTNRVRVYKFLSRTLRKDGVFPWQGGIQYHHYSNRNGHGITPEEDSLRSRLKKVKDCTFRIEPGVPCILGENGYDKNPQSLQNAPQLPGYDIFQSQGAMILRAINATAFAGFDAYILYWLKDGNDEKSPVVYSTSGILRNMPDGTTKAYPAWYYISCLVKRLGDYAPDSIISERGKVWIYKYRNQLHTDSVAYFIYCPSHSGTMIENYALKVPFLNQRMVEIEFADNDEMGHVTTLESKKGELTFRVDEKPKLILAREQR